MEFQFNGKQIELPEIIDKFQHIPTDVEISDGALTVKWGETAALVCTSKFADLHRIYRAWHESGVSAYLFHQHSLKSMHRATQIAAIQGLIDDIINCHLMDFIASGEGSSPEILTWELKYKYKHCNFPDIRLPQPGEPEHPQYRKLCHYLDAVTTVGRYRIVWEGKSSFTHCIALTVELISHAGISMWRRDVSSGSIPDAKSIAQTDFIGRVSKTIDDQVVKEQ